MTLDLAPHLDETIERISSRAPWPLPSCDRFRPGIEPAPQALRGPGSPLAELVDETPVAMWRFAGSLVVQAPPGLYAQGRDDTLVLLPTNPDVAEQRLRWPEAYAQPERAALLFSAWLDLVPLLDQAEVETISGPAMRLMAFAPPRLLEEWRAPARDGDELVFFAGTDPRARRNRILRVTADLANRWIELEERCEGWHAPAAMGETDWREPMMSINFAAPPELPDPRPPGPPIVNVAPDPPGLLARLRRLFGGD